MVKEAGQREKAEHKINRLFTANYGKWLGYAVRHNLNSNDAEDIIQSVVLRILEKKDSLILLPDNELEAYIMESIKNAIKNSLTRTKQFDSLQEEFFPSEESAEEIVLTGLEYSDIKEAVRKLSEVQRTIIYMNYYQNIEVSQIAKELDMTDNAVRSYKSRAMKMLRRIIADKNIEKRG